ncbi:signal-induced proliferation-associated 1-like protein 1 isoform X2 [Eupeodes corollae]|uniref:signal-induced proliferation-associated 1-like protein 1 isoform X1 n=1 Tax=Eupeodes corollae TaxID=290404 RepID=UPI002492BBC4|nr:signal-induced proliferation-associated 1-like protein 1 isoform X1 [Eupeodes corollae]XP_055915850.1 signal-induced proliferation-associated 1-like protein 1 isoform X2 [Eupeodes corollae]
MYNSTEHVTGNKSLTNGVVYATPQKNLAKAESKVIGNFTKNQELYAPSNQSSSFASRSRITSNERDQNFYRKTNVGHATSSHDTGQNKNDSFFDMLQDYQPAVLGVIGTNQRSPGPAEFMQDKEIKHQPNYATSKDTHDNTNHQNDSSCSHVKISRDLKVKNKIHRFLVHPKSKSDDNGLLGLSILTKNIAISEDITKQTHSVSLIKRTFLSPEDMQEQQRKRSFGHYDCQSLAAIVNYERANRKISNSNIRSSADITKPLKSISPELKNSFQELNHGNELLESCSHFCNEIGGDNDGRFGSKKSRALSKRPITPCSVSILESLPNETLWRVGVCPFQSDSCPIESVDHGAHYYKRYFYNQKHENWFGIDDNLGPVAISIKKEKINDVSNDPHSSQPRYHFRIIIRTSELLTLRGLVLEDCIINSRVSAKSATSKELVEYIAPDIQLNCLRLGVSSNNSEQQLLKLDEQGLQSKYKVGILYCRSGQSSEEDMYNNEHAGPAFTEFLDIIGKRVRLKGFQQYKAGLDNKSDSTGTHSIYAFYKNCEIMFHVCTMLPFTPNNRQQLLRKRHIGNDIVTIIFQEPGALPFDPNNIRSQFQHVFLIVRAVNPCSNNTTYRVAITRSKEVPVFGPPLPASALFSRNKMFAEFILAKTINAENAAHRSDKFANLAIRTRREYLKDLCINYCTNTSIDPGNKFSIFPNRKKEKMKIQFYGDLSQRGAICWRIMLQDHGLDQESDCFLGISTETFVIIEGSSRTVIFSMPTRSILGWTIYDDSFRIFYHNGECITFNMFYKGAREEEHQQVIERLNSVTLGNGALELNMRRNMMGQLGFHVQPDGIVTQVDATGQAWASGMRRGYRLVEVCKIVVATLSYAELIDLLKTSAQMNAIVIKSVSDGNTRLGCFNKNCKVNILSQEFIHSSSNKFLLEKDGYRVKSFLRKEASQHPTQSYNSSGSGSYEQRSLPHKSKNNSVYNTQSSCFSSNSLGDEYKKSLQHSNSSSPHSLQNGKWYDTLEDPEHNKKSQYGSNHQYSLKSFESSLNFNESSGMKLNPNTSHLTPGDGSELQSWLQSQSDNRKLQNRRAEYELTGFKSVNSSPNESYNFDKGVSTSYSEYAEHTKISDTQAGLKNKNNFPELPTFPSTSTAKTAKVGGVLNGFSTSMNSFQKSTRNYPATNQFRPDLLEIISPHCFSHYDRLQANIIPVVERESNMRIPDDSLTSPTTNILRNVEKQQTFAAGNSVKKHQANLSASESPTRHKPKSSQDHSIASTALPLLPYSNKLDWTTLVDTATKAIILQHRDDNS